MAEIEQSLSRTKSLIFRVLKELERQDIVERVQSTRYRLGIETFEMGAAYVAQSQFIDVVRRVLQSVAHETGETVNLGVLRGDEVLYLLKFVGRSSYITISHVGGRVPATCVAIGKVLLAELSDDEVRKVVQTPLTQMTPLSFTSVEDLIDDLHLVRERGYGMDEEQAVLGRHGLAVAVAMHDNHHARAAISLSANADEFPQNHEKLLDLLLLAKRRIDRETETRAVMNDIPAAW